MSDVKHTQGPWVVNPLAAQVDCSALDEYGNLLPICQLLWPTEYRSETETEANANLIAAAPAMLEALQDLKSRGLPDRYSEDQELIDRVDAIIARATGKDEA